MELARLDELIHDFRRRRVLVVGDCMLDEYVWGRVSRISPEAPVMVVEQERTSHAAGGASNVAANLVALGAQAGICGVSRWCRSCRATRRSSLRIMSTARCRASTVR